MENIACRTELSYRLWLLLESELERSSLARSGGEVADSSIVSAMGKDLFESDGGVGSLGRFDFFEGRAILVLSLGTSPDVK